MKPIGKTVLTSVLALVASASLLAGCGGGGHSTLPAAPVTTTSDYHGPLATATFKITIPAPPTTTSKTRRPAYVSSSTSQVVFTLNTDTVGLTGANLATFNTNVLGSKTVTLGSATCPGGGPWTCTIAIQLPPGSDNVTMSANDLSNNVLSQQVQTFTVNVATTNSFSVTLDANAATLSLSGTQACTSGSIGSVFGTVGTTPVHLNASYTDLAGKTIIAPGLPNLQVQANHSGDTTYHSDSGTIDGTGGTVSFAINQAAQMITLTPSTTPISNATVNVKAVPPSADLLTFSQTHTFTFSAGNAPPASFLAVVEQSGSTGQINFYTVGLVAGGPDSLSPYSTPTLATTTSINAAPDGQQPDVDNPQDVAFDGGGNLLIANGGTSTNGDFGNFACVPAGAISSGANLATTNRTGLRDPIAIAVASNGTVGLANNPASAAVNVQEFTLGTNYVAGSSLTNPGSYGVPINRPFVVLPTLTTGTFAVGLYNGTHSLLDILAPGGSVGSLSDSSDSHLQDPNGMGWDASSNQQLVVADNNAYNSYLNFYTVSNAPAAPVNVKSFLLQNDPDPANDCPGASPCAGMIGQKVAVSPAGVVAVAGLNLNETILSGEEIQLYDSSSSRNPAGVIPFDTNTTSAGACSGSGPYTYGGPNGQGPNAVIQEMRWLSSTKLLVLLSTDPSALSAQGIYIFDTSTPYTAQPPGWWCPEFAFTPTQPPLGPKNTTPGGVFNIQSFVPHAAAYKP